jgi:hypothetical protein
VGKLLDRESLPSTPLERGLPEASGIGRDGNGYPNTRRVLPNMKVGTG